jgi:hypothetical protein
MKKQLNEIYRMQQLAGILKKNNINEDSQPDWSSMGPNYSDSVGGDNEAAYNAIVNQVKKFYQEDPGGEITSEQEQDIYYIIHTINNYSYRGKNKVTLSDGRIISVNPYQKDMWDRGEYNMLSQIIYQIIALVDESINEADTSMDIEREEYINKEINTIIEAIENLQELGLGSVDYILNMIKKEMKIKSTSIPASELPFS